MSSLRFKIIISTFFIISVLIIGSYLLIQDIQKGIIEGEFRDKGHLLANNLATEITTPVLINDLIDVRNSFENRKNNYPDIEYIYVTDSEGIVLVHTFEGGFPDALQHLSKPSEDFQREHVLDTTMGIIHDFDAPLFKNIGYVHVGLSEKGVNAQILAASRKLLFLAISAVVLGGIFTFFIGRRLTEPILELTKGANRINNGILDQIIDIRSRDELGELAKTFNKMAMSLDQKIKDLVASKEQTENAERYLETLFNSIDDGIIVLNINHAIIKMNEAFIKMMGLTEEQLMGRTCHELIFGLESSTNEAKRCPLEKLLRTKKPERIVHEVDFNGNKKIFEINTSLLSDKKGTVNIIMVLRDATQQKLLEEEITERNKELTVLNNISKNINETFDLDKILLRTLENLLKLTGMGGGCIYLIDEKSGDFALKVHMGEDGSRNPLKHIEKFNKVLTVEDTKGDPGIMPTEGNYSSLANIPLKSKDKVLGIIILQNNEPHSFSSRDRALFSAVGNQVGVAVENVIFYNNIKSLKEFNDDILDNINQAIHVIDKDMRILTVNYELIKLGRGKFKKEHIINKNIFDVYPFLLEKHVDKEYEHVFKTGEIFQSEERTDYHNEIIYTSTSKIPIKDREGNVEKVITVMRDVTETKILEEDLKNSYKELKLTYSKLKELYKIKDSFLSNVSHELRTPLTSILGFTELLLEGDINEDQRHKLNIIMRNSKRLHNAIKGLLDTTLIESSNLQLDRHTFSLYDIVTQVAEDMKIMASIKNIPIKIEMSEQLMIDGDRDRLIQVLSNIVDNAIKFTISGEVRITAEKEDKCLHIKISDTGIGIPEEKLELIFDRFYQLDESRTREYGGLGIGLWVSKNIIKAHGGKIWAESKNRGSAFHILLPGRRENEQEIIQ